MNTWEEIRAHVLDFIEEDYNYVVSHYGDFGGNSIFCYLKQEYNFTHVMCNIVLLKAAPIVKQIGKKLDKQANFEWQLCVFTNYILCHWGMALYSRFGGDVVPESSSALDDEFGEIDLF